MHMSDNLLMLWAVGVTGLDQKEGHMPYVNTYLKNGGQLTFFALL